MDRGSATFYRRRTKQLIHRSLKGFATQKVIGFLNAVKRLSPLVHQYLRNLTGAVLTIKKKSRTAWLQKKCFPCTKENNQLSFMLKRNQMHHTKFFLTALLFGSVSLWSCQSANTETETKTLETTANNASSHEVGVERGRFIVEIGGCNDCHSPKQMTAQGPVVDGSRKLSGHPAGDPIPPVIESALKPGNWLLMAPDLTAFVGPWGISYAANITSDSATGIGAWTDDQFIKTMRTGKHLGLEGGRPILPPMPWQEIGKLSDEDLKAMLAYLKTLPAIDNRVPAPVPPDQAMTMK